MSDYNVNNDLLGKSGDEKPNYMMAALAGLGISVLVAIALAAIGIWLETEYALALIIGAVLIGMVIRNFVPSESIGGAVLGAILCPATYFLYQSFMAIFGYAYESNDNIFWWVLAGSFIYGAYMGYNGSND